MDPILVFLIFPIAVIIFSIALEKLLNSPILVAAIIFIIGLIIALTVFGGSANAIIAVTIITIITIIIIILIHELVEFVAANED